MLAGNSLKICVSAGFEISSTLIIPLLSLQEQKAFKCAYVMLIMATFWVTEALPLAITSLLPVTLLPLLGKSK